MRVRVKLGGDGVRLRAKSGMVYGRWGCDDQGSGECDVM